MPNQVIPEKPLIIGEPSYIELPIACNEVIAFVLSGESFTLQELNNFVDEKTSVVLVELLIDHQIIITH